VADPADIAHLLRRTEFVVKPERLNALKNLTIAQAVDDVMNVGLNGDISLPADFQDEADNSWQQGQDAYAWWFTQMLTRPRPFLEKMTLFWHGHFTSAIDGGVYKVHLMMWQNDLYRHMALGSFRDFTQKMAIQPAMLLYLSGADNIYDPHDSSVRANENFARELMELFTLGVGNYTQDDVAAAAAAWTGHNYVEQIDAYQFIPKKHDPRNKTFFGQTRNWDGPDIINAILGDEFPDKKWAAARYVTRRLFDFFAYPGAPFSIIDPLAQVFLNSDLSISAVMKAILTSDAFFSDAAKHGLVRTPTEYLVELLYRSKVKPEDAGLSWHSDAMGQVLFNPPNVSGWRPNSYWLNTSAISGRADAARDLTWHLRDKGGFDELYKMTTPQAVDYVANFFGVTLTAQTRNALMAAYDAEKASVKWDDWNAPTNLLTMVMVCPEINMA
jgi:uncharacterized protein (DUF1800 family)